MWIVNKRKQHKNIHSINVSYSDQILLYFCQLEMSVQINIDNEEFILQKQNIPDNVLSFVPKTGTSRFDKHQMFELSIPRTNHVVRLNKAYLQVVMKLKMKKHNSNGDDDDYYIGMNNAACIFDQVQIKNNGKTIYSNTYSQISSRLWQMSKSKEYLDSMPYCFINYNDISKNEGFIYKNVNDLKTDDFTDVEFRMRIPLAAVFECFDNCDNFSTTQLSDDIVLSLQLSEPYKYLTIVEADDDEVIRVEKFYSEEQLFGFDDHVDKRKPDINNSISFLEDGHYIEIKTDSESYYIDSFKMNVPCHYPTDDEKEAFSQLIHGGSVSFPYKSWEIDKYSVCFSEKKNSLEQTITNKNIIANFSSNAPNIYGIMILFISDDNRVVYDKPYISSIECNLNEIVKLANNRVHTDSTYTGDNDMYKDFCNNFGADYFKNLSRFDSAITHDYGVKDITDRNLFGSYCQWYQIAAGNQMGFSGDYFANLINYKCQSEYISATETPNNRSNGSIVCVTLCQKMLLFRNSGLSIVAPFSEEMNMKKVIRNENQTHGLGLISAIAQPVTSAGKGLIRMIKDKVDERRANKNTTYAYTKLGKDKYMSHQDIIEKNQSWRPKKFRQFIDKLISIDHGLVMRHGISDAGIPSANDLSNIDQEKAITLEDINLPYQFNYTHQLELYSKEYKSLIPFDYKVGLNRNKIHLTSYGNEMSMENVSHGLRNWLRDKWSRFRNWIHKNKDTAVNNIKENSRNIIKQYVSDIMSGKIKPQNVPSKFKNDVMNMLRTGSLTGTDFDKIGSDAVKYYNDFKTGKIKAEDIPREIFDKIKDLSINNSPNHGLVLRHGFISPIKIKSSIPSRNMKTRILLMQEKDPNLLTQKELKQMYLYKYLKSHKNDNHGISNDVWKKLKYGNFKRRNNFHNNQDMNKLSDPKQKYNDIISKINSIKKENKNNETNETNDEHGMKRSEWKSLDKLLRRKLKKYGFTRYSDINPAFIAYLTKKLQKKKLKKSAKNTF